MLRVCFVSQFDCGGMIHEEVPSKLTEALLLFLQGLGHGERSCDVTSLITSFGFLIYTLSSTSHSSRHHEVLVSGLRWRVISASLASRPVRSSATSPSNRELRRSGDGDEGAAQGIRRQSANGWGSAFVVRRRKGLKTPSNFLHLRTHFATHRTVFTKWTALVMSYWR